MLIILEIIVAIYIILSLFFKIDYSKTYCGIFAFSAKPNLTVEQLKIAYHKLLILGLYNESRGTHGCGLYIGGELKKGFDKNKLFKTFISNNGFEIDETSTTMIGHCRQASRGDHSEKNTHPFKITNDAVPIVGVMNGTVTNIDELSKKYEVSCAYNDNDSKILFEIISKTGLDVLNEYRGGAALIWTEDIYQGKMFVYHGKSKAYSSTEPIEERPLFYLETEYGIFFSSMDDSLFAIADIGDYVIQLDHNKVFYVENGKFTGEVIEINREKVVNTVYTYNNYPDYTKNSNSSFTKVGGGSNNLAEKEANLYSIWRETVPFSVDEDKLLYHTGRYFIKDSLCNGEFYLDNRGYSYSSENSNTTKYYFYEGVMIASKKMYDCLLEDITSNVSLIPSEGYNFAHAISKYSKYPVINLPKEGGKILQKEHRLCWYDSQKTFNGNFSAKFSKRSYKISDGVLTKITSSDFADTEFFYSSIREAFDVKKSIKNSKEISTKLKDPCLFENLEEENYENISDKNFTLVFTNYFSLSDSLTTLQRDALSLVVKKRIKCKTDLDPDDFEIKAGVQNLLVSTSAKFKSVYDMLDASEIVLVKKFLKESSFLQKEIEEFKDSVKENEELIKELMKEELINLVDTLGDLNNISDNLQCLDNEIAQNMAKDIYIIIGELKKQLDSIAKDKSLSSLKEALNKANLVTNLI